MSKTFRQKVSRLFSRIGYLHIFVFALLLRAVYLCQAWLSNELIDHPLVDAQIYLRWARSIVENGSLLWAEPINYTPMYPAYLAMWISVFGETPPLLFAAFHLLGAGQAILLGKAAETVWSRREGLITALIAAACWPFIVFEATFYSEHLALWNLAASFFFLCRSLARNKPGLMLAAGFFMTLSALCRANELLCIGAIAGWLTLDSLFTAKKASDAIRTAAKRAVLFLLPAIIILAPIMTWNYQRSGSAILRTQAGLSLYLGNNPEFEGLVVSPGLEWNSLVHEPIRAGKLSLEDRESFWIDRTISTIQTNPIAWLKLQGKKLFMHFGSYEVSQEIDVYRYREASSVLGLIPWPGFWLILPFGLAGMFQCLRKRHRWSAIFAVFATAYAVSMFPFQAASRYRLPLAMALIPIAAYAMTALWDRRKDRVSMQKAMLVILLIAAVFVPDWTGLGERNVIPYWHQAATRLYHDGDYEGALVLYGKAVDEDPNDADSLLRMGHIHLRFKNLDEARRQFVLSRQRYDNNTEALIGLAQYELISKRPDAAEQLLLLALEERPDSFAALRYLSSVYLMKKNRVEAERVLSHMVLFASCPVDFKFRLAELREQLGDHKGARDIYWEIADDPVRRKPERTRAIKAIQRLEQAETK